MSYLIEMNVPGEGWKPFDVTNTRPLSEIMEDIGDVCTGDELADMRVRRIDPEQYPATVTAVTNYWGAPWNRPLFGGFNR